MVEAPLGQRSGFWIVHAKVTTTGTVLHSQQDRHPKVTGRTVSALETPSHTTEVTNIDNHRHRLAKARHPALAAKRKARQLRIRLRAQPQIQTVFVPDEAIEARSVSSGPGRPVGVRGSLSRVCRCSAGTSRVAGSDRGGGSGRWRIRAACDRLAGSSGVCVHRCPGRTTISSSVSSSTVVVHSSSRCNGRRMSASRAIPASSGPSSVRSPVPMRFLSQPTRPLKPRPDRARHQFPLVQIALRFPPTTSSGPAGDYATRMKASRSATASRDALSSGSGRFPDRP